MPAIRRARRQYRALGAFLAGVVVSESPLSHQVGADVLPFREAFAVLFFVSVGMLVDPRDLLARAGPVAALTALIIGTSVLGAEVDDGSIVHLLATPVPRLVVIWSKYVVAVVLTAAFVAVPLLVLLGTAARYSRSPSSPPPSSRSFSYCRPGRCPPACAMCSPTTPGCR